MKEALTKCGAVCRKIFGWGMFLSLLSGVLLFFGYIAALCLGGTAAAGLCEFLYTKMTPVMVVMTTVLILLGLLSMYLTGEKALTPEPPEKSEQKPLRLP